jgi:hypothetical protein
MKQARAEDPRTNRQISESRAFSAGGRDAVMERMMKASFFSMLKRVDAHQVKIVATQIRVDRTPTHLRRFP